jgi:hypothetical protein
MGKRKKKGIKRSTNQISSPRAPHIFRAKGDRGPRLVLYFFFMLLMALLMK